jgi:hypothetical protein
MLATHALFSPGTKDSKGTCGVLVANSVSWDTSGIWVAWDSSYLVLLGIHMFNLEALTHNMCVGPGISQYIIMLKVYLLFIRPFRRILDPYEY